MTAQILEVYLDSFRGEPIARATAESFSINIGDEITKEDWLRLLSGSASTLELRVKVKDVNHLFWDDVEEHSNAINIKVVPV